MRPARPIFLFLLTCAAWPVGGALWPLSVNAQQVVPWRTGTELERHLERPLDLAWDDVPLRDGLNRLAEVHRVAIFLDRRIDPDQKMQLSVQGEPLELVLLRIATLAGGATCQVGDVIYLGPESTAERLPTVAELQSQFARSHGSAELAKLLERRPYQWPEAATPRQILEDIAQSAGLQWNQLGQTIPHDLWPAVALPPLRKTELLSLVLAGFDASYRLGSAVEGVRLEPIPIPATVTLTKTYPFEGDVPAVLAQVRELYPDVEIDSDGRQLVVTGSQQHQAAIAKFLRGRPVRRRVAGDPEKRYTLTVQEQPFGPVVRQLGNQLGLTVSLPEVEPAVLNRRISFSVQEVDLVGLLDAVFAGSGFTYDLAEDQLAVVQESN